MFKIEDVKTPKWMNAEKTRLDVVVKFSGLEDYIPFTADHEDCESHCCELFHRAVEGEFGAIAPYVPPTELEIAKSINPSKRKSEMKKASDKVTHYIAMGEDESVTDWRLYYRALYTLDTLEGWPIVKDWPTSPEE